MDIISLKPGNSLWWVMITLCLEGLSLWHKWMMLIVLPLLGLCISSTSIFPAALPFPAARTTTTAPNGAYSNSIPTSTVYANSPPCSITDYGNDGNNNNATYSRSSSSGGIVTAGKPLFQEHIVIVGAIPVNQTFKKSITRWQWNTELGKFNVNSKDQ